MRCGGDFDDQLRAVHKLQEATEKPGGHVEKRDDAVKTLPAAQFQPFADIESENLYLRRTPPIARAQKPVIPNLPTV